MTATAADLPAILGGVPTIPAGPPPWPPDDDAVAAALHAVIADRSWGRYHGPHCGQLRAALAALHGVPHIHLCASGTAAVELALRGLGVGAGDEVLLAAYDFKANFADVLATGATPVLVDVRSDDAQLDVARLEAAASPATAAVLVSHLHGGAVHMPRLRALADAHGWAVLEDACQTPGSTIHDRPAGTWGDVGVLSFGGSKLLSAGRGGAVLTARDDVQQRITRYTQRGNDLSPLSEVQAAILLPQVETLAHNNARRTAGGTQLIALLADEPALQPLACVRTQANHQPGLYKLGFWYNSAACAGLSRELFAAAMRAEGVALSPGFAALHRTHARRRFRSIGELPHADAAADRLLVLHHPVLLEEPPVIAQVAMAVARVRSFAAPIAERLPADHAAPLFD